MIDALKRVGAENAKLTVYPEAGHDSWTQTYEDPEFFQWTLQQKRTSPDEHPLSGNPVFKGWYADAKGISFGDPAWIDPTYSARYEQQVFLDCFSSKDLLTWKEHSRILDTDEIKWAKRAM